MEKVIFNTDIFGDFDDLLALTLGLKSGIDIKGVVTTKEDIRDKAICTKKLLDLAERPDIPVFYSGQKRKTSKKRRYMNVYMHSIYSSNDSMKQDSELEISSQGIEHIINTINRNPGKINLISLSTCTNIAEAIKEDHCIVPKIKGIHIMGGVLDNTEKNLNKPEHNYMSDRKSFDYVLGQKVPIFLVPRDVTLDLFLQPEVLEERENTSKFYQAVYHLSQEFLEHQQRDSFRLSDVITLGTLLYPELFDFQPVTLETQKGNQGDISYCVPTKKSNVNAVYNFDRQSFYTNFVRAL